ncbi:MAG: PAS domain-containing protein [Actinomycetota bacterium]|nr:PAS domain-containing protein [Actinomycetota bacterium]
MTSPEDGTDGYEFVAAGILAGADAIIAADRTDGTRLSLEFAIHPVHEHDGALVGIAATLRDVTSQFEEMRALRQRAAPEQ